MTGLQLAADTATRFASQLLVASGADAHEADIVAASLVWSDQIGRSTQGIWRLPNLCKRIQHRVVRTPCEPQFESSAQAVHRLNGDQGMGHYVGQLAMERAIELARVSGVGVVVACNSNFYGAGAYYANQAAAEGMLGVALSNSYPKVAPYGGRTAKLGTNPLAFAAPRRNGESILVDLATSQSSGSQLRKFAELGHALPPGTAVDEHGQPITDPNQVDGGALLPFGGAKGFGLGLMVEILSGVITGAGIASEVNSTVHDFQRSGQNGHFFLALDIRALMPLDVYFQRIEFLEQHLKTLPTGSIDPNVRLPGDLRWYHFVEARKFGLRFDAPTRAALERLAAEHRVTPPW